MSAGNQFSGSVPQAVSTSTSLQFVWMGSNNLVGTLPVEFASVTSLVELNMNDAGVLPVSGVAGSESQAR